MITDEKETVLHQVNHRQRDRHSEREQHVCRLQVVRHHLPHRRCKSVVCMLPAQRILQPLVCRDSCESHNRAKERESHKANQRRQQNCGQRRVPRSRALDRRERGTTGRNSIFSTHDTHRRRRATTLSSTVCDHNQIITITTTIILKKTLKLSANPPNFCFDSQGVDLTGPRISRGFTTSASSTQDRCSAIPQVATIPRFHDLNRCACHIQVTTVHQSAPRCGYPTVELVL